MRKVDTAMHCNLKAIRSRASYPDFNYKAYNAPDYKFNTSTTFSGFGDLYFLSRMDILMIGGHLPEILTAQEKKLLFAKTSI